MASADKRCIYRSAPELEDVLSYQVVGTPAEMRACLRLQRAHRRITQKHQVTSASKEVALVAKETTECTESATDADDVDGGDECAVCYQILCEPVRWPAAPGGTCEHVFCKPCVRRWAARRDACCPLCRAPASTPRHRKFDIDQSLAAEVERRHPGTYAESLVLHRQMSRTYHLQDREGTTRVPVIIGYDGVSQRAYRQAHSINAFRGFFSFTRTEHLTALAHALASSTGQRRVMVLPDEECGVGASGRLVTITLSARELRATDPQGVLEKLIQMRARHSAVTVRFDVDAGIVELEEPVEPPDEAALWSRSARVPS